jgi:hypothetical protein
MKSVIDVKIIMRRKFLSKRAINDAFHIGRDYRQLEEFRTESQRGVTLTSGINNTLSG